MTRHEMNTILSIMSIKVHVSINAYTCTYGTLYENEDY